MNSLGVKGKETGVEDNTQRKRTWSSDGRQVYELLTAEQPYWDTVQRISEFAIPPAIPRDFSFKKTLFL